MEEKECYVATARVKDSSTSSSQATDAILRKKSKNVALLDESMEQTDDLAVLTPGNLTEVSVVPKKAKRMKGHSACQDNPSNRLPKESNPFTGQVNSELVLENAGVDSMSENTTISHHTPSVVGKEYDPSKSSDIHPDEKLNMAADMRSTSSTRTSGSKKKKIKQRATSVKEDAPNLSANGYYSSDVVSTDKIEKNSIGESIDTITRPLVSKEDANLTKGVDIGSSHGMKTYTSRRNTGVTQEGKNSSFSSSQSLQENANRLPSEAAKNHMLLNRAAKATDLGSANKNDCSKKTYEKKKKNAAISSDIAAVDSSSLPEIVDMEPAKIINRAPVGCVLALSANGEGLSGTADADGGKKRDMTSDICLNSSQTASASSKKTHKKKKKNAAISSDIAAVDSLSLPEIVGMEPAKIINRVPVGCVLALSANGEGLLGTADADGGKKRDMPSDICLNSSETASRSSKKAHRKKKKNSATSSDVAVVDSSSLSGCDLVPLASEETVGLTGVGSDKTDKLLEMSINSESVIEKSPRTSKKTRRKGKNKIDDCSDSKLEPDPSISSSMNSSLTADFKLVGKINVDSDAVNDVLNIGTNNSDPAKIAGDSVPNESHSLKELDSDSYQTEEPGSLQTKMDMRKTGKSSNCRTCPSPIRGVIDDFASTQVVSKHDNQFDLFKEGNVGFSFPVPDKVLLDHSSGSHSEKATQSGVPVGSENVAPANNNDNDLCSIETCRNSDTVGDPVKKEVAPSSCHIQKFPLSSDLSRREDKELEALLPKRLSISSIRKKLLVLDLNGLLADIFLDIRNVHKALIKVRGKSVFKRPFCDDFLKFCFDRFEIGIWSSRQRCNVDDIVNYLMGDARHKLLFCWDQSKCTVTGFRTIENTHKPLVLKELKKLWNKEEPNLPWEKGEYLPSNTLLVDDSPYKALCNPPHTAIFPHPYNFSDEKDRSLGPGGDLRVYLEGLASANNVQQYVEEHAFGQLAITKTDPSWKFYLRIIDKFENTSASARGL